MTSVGAWRRLMQCSDATGTFCILAVDHRDNLIAELQKHQPASVTAEDVVAFKRSVMRASGETTAVLLDPDYGVPGMVAGGVPGGVGMLAPLEVTDYRPHPSLRPLRPIPGWDPGTLARSGFSGAKLLVFFHPDADDAAEKTTAVDRLIGECQSHDVPLFLEPIATSLDPGRPLDNIERRRVVVESARHFSRRGATIMKMEFPLDVTIERNEEIWREALQELDEACAVPWTLLSAGAPFGDFLRQTIAACQAGASGVIAGRAVWAEAVPLDADGRDAFVERVARRRLEQLRAICRGLARPWFAKIAPPQVTERWYARGQVQETAR